MLQESIMNTEQNLFSAVEIMMQQNKENEENSVNSMHRKNEDYIDKKSNVSTQLKILQMLNTINENMTPLGAGTWYNGKKENRKETE